MQSAPVPINDPQSQNIMPYPEQKNSICANTQPNCIYTVSGELICGINKAASRENCPEDYAKDDSVRYLNNNYFGTS